MPGVYGDFHARQQPRRRPSFANAAYTRARLQELLRSESQASLTGAGAAAGNPSPQYDARAIAPPPRLVTTATRDTPTSESRSTAPSPPSTLRTPGSSAAVSPSARHAAANAAALAAAGASSAGQPPLPMINPPTPPSGPAQGSGGISRQASLPRLTAAATFVLGSYSVDHVVRQSRRANAVAAGRALYAAASSSLSQHQLGRASSTRVRAIGAVAAARRDGAGAGAPPSSEEDPALTLFNVAGNPTSVDGTPGVPTIDDADYGADIPDTHSAIATPREPQQKIDVAALVAQAPQEEEQQQNEGATAVLSTATEKPVGQPKLDAHAASTDDDAIAAAGIRRSSAGAASSPNAPRSVMSSGGSTSYTPQDAAMQPSQDNLESSARSAVSTSVERLAQTLTMPSDPTAAAAAAAHSVSAPRTGSQSNLESPRSQHNGAGGARAAHSTSESTALSPAGSIVGQASAPAEVLQIPTSGEAAPLATPPSQDNNPLSMDGIASTSIDDVTGLPRRRNQRGNYFAENIESPVRGMPPRLGCGGGNSVNASYASDLDGLDAASGVNSLWQSAASIGGPRRVQRGRGEVESDFVSLTIGEYLILHGENDAEVLGRGAYGEVYLATHMPTSRQVAIKTVDWTRFIPATSQQVTPSMTPAYGQTPVTRDLPSAPPSRLGGLASASASHQNIAALAIGGGGTRTGTTSPSTTSSGVMPTNAPTAPPSAALPQQGRTRATGGSRGVSPQRSASHTPRTGVSPEPLNVGAATLQVNDDGNASPMAEGATIKGVPEIIAREVTIMETLKNENLLRLERVYTHPTLRRLFLVLPLMKKPLLELNDRGLPKEVLSETDAAAVFRRVLAGLRYMHEKRKMVHLDIKPSNILLDEEGKAYISDFGTSWAANARSGAPRTHAGTVPFQPPEYFDNEEKTDWTFDELCKFDMWALGVTMYMTVFGKHPFSGAIPKGMPREMVVDAIQNTKLEFPSYPEVSPECQAVIKRLLARDPARRPLCKKFAKLRSWTLSPPTSPAVRPSARTNAQGSATVQPIDVIAPPALAHSTALVDELREPATVPSQPQLANDGGSGSASDELHSFGTQALPGLSVDANADSPRGALGGVTPMVPEGSMMLGAWGLDLDEARSPLNGGDSFFSPTRENMMQALNVVGDGEAQFILREREEAVDDDGHDGDAGAAEA